MFIRVKLFIHVQMCLILELLHGDEDDKGLPFSLSNTVRSIEHNITQSEQ